ncbi:MAG TPA: carbon storage regulator [Phycisphaerales bacterium]|nr:carbon storage regulator [Phycisphaerales bacterium]
MLVLSRQRDETIMIGDEVEITVVDIRGDKVRLGITAPARVAVHRKEVYEAIQAENRHAAGSADPSITSIRPGANAGSVRPQAISRLRGASTPQPGAVVAPANGHTQTEQSKRRA